MTNAWLRAVAADLERVADTSLQLTGEEVDELLELAAFAAHESGAKLNAPLLCYLVGRAAAASGRSVDELALVARAAATA